MGIASEIAFHHEAFRLSVDSGVENAARDQLAQYESENGTPVKSTPAPKLHEAAWIAPALYAVSMVSIAFLAGRDLFSFDWYATGALSSSIQSTHQWWRAVTALTLHADHDHLLRNLGFGAFFYYAAARLMGPGIAFAGAFFAAIVGNVLDSVLMPRTHVSIGASTIVFATLGLISAYSWRIQFSKRMQWAHRWAPLVIGVALLGFLGSGGENTDVLAHLTGFASGVVAAVMLANVPMGIFDSKAVQAASAVAPLLLLSAAWTWAAASLPHT